MKELKVGNSIKELRLSAKYYPYAYIFRSASALRLGNIALQQQKKYWDNVAYPELKDALKYDPYAPDLLVLMIINDLNLGLNKDAQKLFNEFKMVNKKSFLIEYVKNLHKN